MSAPFVSMPVELLCTVDGNLEFPDAANLRNTCIYFKVVLKPLSHAQFLELEKSKIGFAKKVYACKYCLILRPFKKFPDEIRWARMWKGSADSHSRVCIDCRLTPRARNNQYLKGTRLSVNWVPRVVCICCGELRKTAGAGDSWGEVSGGKSLICEFC
jgi:hypothetical protein